MIVVLKIDLDSDLELRLNQAAAEAGMPAEEFAVRALEERLCRNGRQAIGDLLDSWSREDATDDSAELQARRESLDALKAALNENRPSQRKLFP